MDRVVVVVQEEEEAVVDVCIHHMTQYRSRAVVAWELVQSQ
jgi:hypothetical protein